MDPAFDLKFTICFCRAGDRVLMLRRAKEPHLGKWNGLGGKFKPGETPEQAIRREMLEESGLALHGDEPLRLTGIVTWRGSHIPENDHLGMYAFIMDVPERFATDEVIETREGTLAWKPIAWLLDHTNNAVADNVPHFLPRMLAELEPVEYHCVYQNQKLREFTIRPWNV